jgi:hypothetical protein
MIMTTTSAPTVTSDVAALASQLGVAAATRSWNIDALFAKWQECRIASAQHSPDILASTTFADVLEAVLTRRAQPDSTPVDVLALAATTTRRTS